VSFRDDWQYDGQDPALLLFSAALKAWGFEIKPGDRVLELGCCETDFAKRLKATVPGVYVVGIDVRAEDYAGDALIVADASRADLFTNPVLPAQSFDWVIALGAIEHFGLGYYGDPKVPNADTLALSNAWVWLKPGGSVYFDVPWSPTSYHETAHYRVYTDRALRERFTHSLQWVARGWAPNDRERDGFTQVRPLHVHEPFWFIAQWGVKT
jgi:cyclopropane fatty-acyl-phospholipid synthase-like methyltransferase